MLALTNLLLMYLGESIHIVVCGGGNTEILRQVDNLYMSRNRVLLQELLALAVAKAKEYYIHLFEGHGIGKAEFCIAQQSLVHIDYTVARITLAIGKDNLYLRMVHEQSNQLAPRASTITLRAMI